MSGGASSVFIDVTGFRVARDDRGRDYIVRWAPGRANGRGVRVAARRLRPRSKETVQSPRFRRWAAARVSTRGWHVCLPKRHGRARAFVSRPTTGLHHQDPAGLLRVDGVPALLAVQAAGRPGEREHCGQMIGRCPLTTLALTRRAACPRSCDERSRTARRARRSACSAGTAPSSWRTGAWSSWIGSAR
jgi:hypothetical protein